MRHDRVLRVCEMEAYYCLTVSKTSEIRKPQKLHPWHPLPPYVIRADLLVQCGPVLQVSLRHHKVIWDCTESKLQQSSRFRPWCSPQAHQLQMTRSPESLVFHQWSLDGGRWLKSSSREKWNNNNIENSDKPTSHLDEGTPLNNETSF